MAKLSVCVLTMCGFLLAQPPVVNPRGVLNAFTYEPAPTRVAPGGIIVIQGINLGPIETTKASGAPLPMRMAEPAVEVLINNRNAPLYSVSAGRILAQVPWETPLGQAVPVMVRRGDQTSRAAFIRVVNNLASVQTKNDKGFGEAGSMSGSRLQLAVTGLGITDPRVDSGAAAPADPPATPRMPVRAYVGGLAADVQAVLSPERVGEFDVTISVPAGAQPGDVVTVTSNGQPPANRTLFGRAQGAELQWVRLPDGAAAIRVLRTADLRGNYVLASEQRGSDGCYPSWLFDLARKTASKVGSCLITAQPNSPSPVVLLNENAAMASLAGPATGEPQTGLSSKVALFQPTNDTPMLVELPAAVTNLNATPDGNLLAIAPTMPPSAFMINTVTGEVAEAQIGAPGGGGGGGAAGGGGAINIANLQIDLGDGIKELLTIPANLGQGVQAALVGDDVNKPTKAKLALLNQRLEVTGTRDFPTGWLPLIPPAPQQAAGQPGQPGAGGPGGPGAPGVPGGPGGLAGRFRAVTYFDQGSRTLYVLSRGASGDSLTAFSGAQLEASTVAFPSGWFVPACIPNLDVFSLELSRRIAIFGGPTAESEVKNPCQAAGLLVLDLATRRVREIPFPGAGQANTQTANGDVNDYVFATNSDGVNRQISDSLYVYDSVSDTPFRLDLPTGVVGFVGVQPVPQLSALIATAVGSRVVGDGGLVYFDLDEGTARVLPVPEGFTAIALVSVFTNTRKVVARGTRTNGNTQYLVYDLITGDLLMPSNPAGVAFVGALPAQPAMPGQGGQPGQGGGQAQAPTQYQVINTKSNFVTAVGFDAQRNPVGVLALRIP